MTASTYTMSTRDMKPHLPVVAGVEITTDAQGRFNLNALHRASGEGANKAPNQWLRTQQVQALISELEGQTANMQSGVLSVVNGGKAPGTFAAEELAVSYAGWISPSFQLEVNRTFIACRKGELVSMGLTESDRGVIGNIVRGCVVKALREHLAELLPALIDAEVNARLASSAMLIRRGKTAKQVWDAAGLPPKIKGSSLWFGNRLADGGCLLEGRADRGDGAVRLYDPDKASTLLGLGLLHKSKVYASERMGQSRFKLVGGA